MLPLSEVTTIDVVIGQNLVSGMAVSVPSDGRVHWSPPQPLAPGGDWLPAMRSSIQPGALCWVICGAL